MANTIRIKRSAIQGKVPAISDLSLGELALNTYHGKLYTLINDGTESVVEIGTNASTLDGQQGSYYQPASTALTTSTTFGGDVSGTYNAIVVANDSHTHDGRYYTETESDARFLGISAKAADSNLLDGIDSSSFLRSDAADTGTGLITLTNGLNVTGSNVGIGTTNPLAKLDVRGNINIGGENAGPNYIAFRGTTGDNPGGYNHTYIGERIWGTTERSELLLFKGNDSTQTTNGDRVRIVGGEIRLDTYSTATSGTFEEVATSANVNNVVTINSDGNVGIGTTNPTEKLEVSGNTILDANNATLKLKSGVTGTRGAIDFTFNTDSTVYGSLDLDYDTRATIGLRLYANYPLTFETGTSTAPIIFKQGSSNESARIDSGGRLLVGTSSSFQIESLITPKVISASSAGSGGCADLFVGSFQNATGSGRARVSGKLFLAHSRSGTTGSIGGLVGSSDRLGEIRFAGDDGTQFLTAAEILGEVDGIPGANDMPGRLVFSTTADGAASPTERMRISNAGNVGIGTTSPGYLLDCQKTGSQLIRSRTNDTGSGTSTGGFLGEYLGGGGGGTNTQIALAAGNNYGFLSTLTNAPLFIGTNSTEKLRIDTSGRVLIGTGSNSGGALLQVNDNRIRIASAKTPASATDTGTAGEICWDANYVYVCTATNTWKRSALSTW
jgi:hypothetical protein